MPTAPYTCMRSHATFQSIYRENFEVVEELRGTHRLFPHTDQLPLLSRALNLEFTGALPQRLACTDYRADPYRKFLLHKAVLYFCEFVNADRQDRVRLFPCCTTGLVTKLGVVQHITTTSPRGGRHTFRIFAGTDFWPDIHLNGKRVVFSTHALERFADRAEHFGEHIGDLLITLFLSTAIVMRLKRGQALVCDHLGSMIALPMEDHGDEYFFTTCLTPPEITVLETDTPPRVMHFHYGQEYIPPIEPNYDR